MKTMVAVIRYATTLKEAMNVSVEVAMYSIVMGIVVQVHIFDDKQRRKQKRMMSQWFLIGPTERSQLKANMASFLKSVSQSKWSDIGGFIISHTLCVCVCVMCACM